MENIIRKTSEEISSMNGKTTNELIKLSKKENNNMVSAEDEKISPATFVLIQKIKSKLIEALSGKKYNNGEQMYDDNNKFVLLEIMSIIYRRMSQKEDPSIVLPDITKFLERNFNDEKDLLYSLDEMKEAVESYELSLKIRKQRLDVGEGLYKCAKCGSSSTISLQKKARASDEPLVTVVNCTDCGKKWTIG